MKFFFPNLILQSRTLFDLFSPTVCGMDSSCEDAILRSSCISLFLLEQRKWWARVFCRSTSLRTLHRKLEITFFQQSFLATLAWMCDVAVADNEKVVRTISETTKRSLGIFLSRLLRMNRNLSSSCPRRSLDVSSRTGNGARERGGRVWLFMLWWRSSRASDLLPSFQQLGKKMARFRRLDSLGYARVCFRLAPIPNKRVSNARIFGV